MARVISSGLGHISGRIGDHIFYAVGDKRYVRRAPAKVSNPRSPAQCLQRWRQVCVQTLFRSVKGTLFQRAADEAAVLPGVLPVARQTSTPALLPKLSPLCNIVSVLLPYILSVIFHFASFLLPSTVRVRATPGCGWRLVL